MTRQRLPDRRATDRFDFTCGNTAFTADYSRDEAGALGEVWIVGRKLGTDSDIVARDSAIVASIALQHGLSADDLRNSLMRNADGSAAGPLGEALDIIAREETAE